MVVCLSEQNERFQDGFATPEACYYAFGKLMIKGETRDSETEWRSLGTGTLLLYIEPIPV